MVVLRNVFMRKLPDFENWRNGLFAFAPVQILIRPAL